MERGFLPEKSPFLGFAAKIEKEKKVVSITNNTFRFASVFPELTVLRLVRKGTPAMKSTTLSRHQSPNRRPRYNHNAIQNQLPPETRRMKKLLIRRSADFVSVFGQNAAFSRIQPSIVEERGKNFKPLESESLCLKFKIHAANSKRFDSVYLPFGNVSETPRYLAFDILARQDQSKKGNPMPWVTLNFSLCGKLYSTIVNMEHWQKIVLPLDGINPSWQYLRILEPTGIFDKKLNSISFEINGVVVYSSF